MQIEATRKDKLNLKWSNTALRRDINAYNERITPEDDGSCPSGYVAGSCTDINECEIGAHQCATAATCANTDGGYSCTCRSGYSGDGFYCEDVDECLSEGMCHDDATCYNTVGGYECECNSGFSGGGMDCSDINECSEGTAECAVHATCANLQGSYSCSCSTGYSGDPYLLCEDIDECAGTSSQHGCQENAVCTNTEGSYTCTCSAGYEGDDGACEDIDECSTSNSCSVFATCMNTEGGYDCTCLSGFTGDGTNCEDIDECAADNSLCGSHATCENTVGSYDCACNAGYSSDGVGCQDIDECDLETDSCASTATCVNSEGGYSCICKNGYEGSGFNCTDVNECASGSHECDVNASCSNHEGTYACSCNPGYSGSDGFLCADVNECEVSTDNCNENAVCFNTAGSFECECICETCEAESGYYYAGMVDDDLILGDAEIVAASAECCDLCVSVSSCLVWSYRPESGECYLGSTDEHKVYSDEYMAGYVNHVCSFEGDGVDCYDANECASGNHNCDTTGGLCVNTEGGFTCGCPEGEDQSTGTCSAQAATCLDILENDPFASSGVYLIQPATDLAPVSVWCDMETEGGGWTVFHRRVDASDDFYRGWNEYVSTFGDPSGNFWVGLENLHAITSTAGQTSLLVTMESAGASYYESYETFLVGDASAMYKLTVEGPSGTAGDSLVYHNGQLFSTNDADHDAHSQNCAERYQGAWWYKGCVKSNLNAHYYGGETTTYADGVNWYTASGFYYSMEFAQMAVRAPIN